MSNQAPYRHPGKVSPLPAPLPAGVKSLFIEYQPLRADGGCCGYDAYVGRLGALGKKLRGWDHVRLVVVEGDADTIDASSRGQWWDLGIQPGGSQCYYDNGTFTFNPQRGNKYSYFGYTGDQCTGDIITANAKVCIDRFRKDGFDVVFRNCLAFANDLASSILDEKEKKLRIAQAQANSIAEMSGVFLPVGPKWL